MAERRRASEVPRPSLVTHRLALRQLRQGLLFGSNSGLIMCLILDAIEVQRESLKRPSN